MYKNKWSLKFLPLWYHFHLLWFLLWGLQVVILRFSSALAVELSLVSLKFLAWVFSSTMCVLSIELLSCGSCFRKVILYFLIENHSITNLKSLTSNLEMKSKASLDTWLKASSSKSYLATVTFAIVSISVSPMKGEIPDNLK